MGKRAVILFDGVIKAYFTLMLKRLIRRVAEVFGGVFVLTGIFIKGGF